MRLFDRFKADVVAVRGAIRTLRLTSSILKNPTRVLPHMLADLAESFGDAPALLSERESFSYRQLSARANRYAQWARARGIAKGHTICLLMHNRPDYVAAWLGLTQAGGAVALLNTHLSDQALAHCINVVAPKHIIAAADLLAPLDQARPHLIGKADIWQHGEAADRYPRIDLALADCSDRPLAPAERSPLTIHDRAVYIYTSGTTGLPKAAAISHHRLLLAALGFAGIMDVKPTDRMYDCLPMYHTAGGLVAIGALLVKGGSVLIREKFSAHEFWNDIVRHDCTLFQYIGELCRYLVNTPPQPNETRHRLRLVCGNGLRADVWSEFQRRFRIPQILEFYAATESNVAIFNFDGKPGAIGRIPWFLGRLLPIKLVKFDIATERPLRDGRGTCLACDVGEIGEAIGKILGYPTKSAARFEGYLSAAENERKILRDVFEPGDAWFRTGDVMRRDPDGYFYFVDRVGDTFRWKGENVSTWEVGETITAFPSVVEANVYGVTIPGYEGRAGMAAVVADQPIDLAKLRVFLAARLPDYARPLFLRQLSQIEVTTTFKHKKLDLAKEGFDPTLTPDPIVFDHPDRQAFVPLDSALFKSIVSGEIRL